ncbi:MAG: hypothetical protein U5K72_06705 [Balneolaceae bacterium]|nr:hypothetical protein [Balneolaceae bacterium]
MIALKHQLTKLLKELSEKEKENQKKLLLLKGLIKGEKAILEDRTITHSEAKKRMSHWLD